MPPFRYTAAMDLLRNFAQGVKPNALEVIPAIEQVVGVLKAKGDLKEFLKRPPDSDAVSFGWAGLFNAGCCTAFLHLAVTPSAAAGKPVATLQLLAHCPKAGAGIGAGCCTPLCPLMSSPLPSCTLLLRTPVTPTTSRRWTSSIGQPVCATAQSVLSGTPKLYQVVMQLCAQPQGRDIRSWCYDAMLRAPSASCYL